MAPVKLVNVSRADRRTISEFLKTLNSQKYVHLARHGDITSMATASGGKAALYNALLLWMYYFKALVEQKRDADDLAAQFCRANRLLAQYVERDSSLANDRRVVRLRDAGVVGGDAELTDDIVSSVTETATDLGRAKFSCTQFSTVLVFGAQSREARKLFRELSRVQNNMLSVRSAVVDFGKASDCEQYAFTAVVYLGQLIMATRTAWEKLKVECLNTINHLRVQLLNAVSGSSGFGEKYVANVLRCPVTEKNLAGVLGRVEENSCIFKDVFRQRRDTYRPSEICSDEASDDGAEQARPPLQTKSVRMFGLKEPSGRAIASGTKLGLYTTESYPFWRRSGSRARPYLRFADDHYDDDDDDDAGDEGTHAAPLDLIGEDSETAEDDEEERSTRPIKNDYGNGYAHVTRDELTADAERLFEPPDLRSRSAFSSPFSVLSAGKPERNANDDVSKNGDDEVEKIIEKINATVI